MNQLEIEQQAQSTFAVLTFILHRITQERWHFSIKKLQHLVLTPSWRVLLACPAGYTDFFHSIFPVQDKMSRVSSLDSVNNATKSVILKHRMYSRTFTANIFTKSVVICYLLQRTDIAYKSMHPCTSQGERQDHLHKIFSKH